MIDNHYRKAGEICHQNGLQIASEAGGPGPPLHNVPVETLKALGALDVPRGEFWSRYTYMTPDSVDYRPDPEGRKPVDDRRCQYLVEPPDR